MGVRALKGGNGSMVCMTTCIRVISKLVDVGELHVLPRAENIPKTKELEYIMYERRGENKL